MVIGLANLVFGGRGSDPEDIVVLRFLHHRACQFKPEKRIQEEKEREKERKKNEWKRRGRGHEEV